MHVHGIWWNVERPNVENLWHLQLSDCLDSLDQELFFCSLSFCSFTSSNPSQMLLSQIGQGGGVATMAMVTGYWLPAIETANVLNCWNGNVMALLLTSGGWREANYGNNCMTSNIATFIATICHQVDSSSSTAEYRAFHPGAKIYMSHLRNVEVDL